MEFYPDERYRHDNKHNKNNTNCKMECMKLENLMVCPKCHCVVLMKSEKMEYVYCSKCHNTLMVPLVYVIAIYQNPMNFIQMPNMMPFMQIAPMIQGGPGPIVEPIPPNNMVNPQGGTMKPSCQGFSMGVGPELYPFYPMMPIPINNMPGTPFPLNIDPKLSNNAYMNNMYMNSNYMNPNYGNPFWDNFTPVDPNYANTNKYNNYNDPNNPKDENDPKDNKVKTPIVTKRASELFD